MRGALALAVLLWALATPNLAPAEFPFFVEVRGQQVALEEHTLYAEPGSAVALQLDGKSDRFSIDYAGPSSISADGTLLLTAPASGELTSAEITEKDSGAKMRIHIIATRDYFRYHTP